MTEAARREVEVAVYESVRPVGAVHARRETRKWGGEEQSVFYTRQSMAFGHQY